MKLSSRNAPSPGCGCARFRSLTQGLSAARGRLEKLAELASADAGTDQGTFRDDEIRSWSTTCVSSPAAARCFVKSKPYYASYSASAATGRR